MIYCLPIADYALLNWLLWYKVNLAGQNGAAGIPVMVLLLALEKTAAITI